MRRKNDKKYLALNSLSTSYKKERNKIKTVFFKQNAKEGGAAYEDLTLYQYKLWLQNLKDILRRN